jgi:hypothetical protein
MMVNNPVSLETRCLELGKGKSRSIWFACKGSGSRVLGIRSRWALAMGIARRNFNFNFAAAKDQVMRESGARQWRWIRDVAPKRGPVLLGLSSIS